MELELDIAIEDETWATKLPDLEKLAADTIDFVISKLDTSRFQSDFPIELSLIFLSDEAIRELNKNYRDKDKPTNVLSFPSLDFEAPLHPEPVIGPMHLGDMALAFGVVESERVEQDKTLSDHTSHLLIHGLLHLLGYDHIDDGEAEEMESLEIQLLSQLGIANPYENKAS